MTESEKRGFRFPHIFNDKTVIENGGASLHRGTSDLDPRFPSVETAGAEVSDRI